MHGPEEENTDHHTEQSAPARIPARGGRIELTPRFDIDARRYEFYGTRPTRFARCGNCRQKFPLSGDPEQDHFDAYRHKQVCLKQEQATAEYGELLTAVAQLPAAAIRPTWWQRLKTRWIR